MSIKNTLKFMVLCFLFISNISLADSMQELINKSSNFGLDVAFSSNTVTITVNEELLSKKLKEVDAVHGFTNPKAYYNFIKSPIISSYDLAVVYAKQLIPYIYKSPSVDYVTFNINILTVNKYGYLDNNPCITFDFSRELFNKINWDRDNDTLLMDIGDDIHVKGSQWCQEQALNESSSNDSDMTINAITHIQGTTTFDGDSISTNGTITTSTH